MNRGSPQLTSDWHVKISCGQHSTMRSTGLADIPMFMHILFILVSNRKMHQSWDNLLIILQYFSFDALSVVTAALHLHSRVIPCCKSTVHDWPVLASCGWYWYGTDLGESNPYVIPTQLLSLQHCKRLLCVLRQLVLCWSDWINNSLHHPAKSLAIINLQYELVDASQ